MIRDVIVCLDVRMRRGFLLEGKTSLPIDQPAVSCQLSCGVSRVTFSCNIKMMGIHQSLHVSVPIGLGSDSHSRVWSTARRFISTR
jgi:hypothetical protein